MKWWGGRHQWQGQCTLTFTCRGLGWLAPAHCASGVCVPGRLSVDTKLGIHHVSTGDPAGQEHRGATMQMVDQVARFGLGCQVASSGMCGGPCTWLPATGLLSGIPALRRTIARTSSRCAAWAASLQCRWERRLRAQPRPLLPAAAAGAAALRPAAAAAPQVLRCGRAASPTPPAASQPAKK